MTEQLTAVQLYENYDKIKAYGQSPEVMTTFVQLLGRTAPSYIQSAITAVQANPKLMECKPISIFRAAIRAATLGLSCDPALGHAFIVPYRNNKTGAAEANFQAGWRGLQHMALRTGKYVYINVAHLYKGEQIVEDRLTGQLKIEGEADPSFESIGLIASFKIVSGLKKAIYMTNEEMDEHGKKYSKSYGFSDSIWKTNKKMAYHKTILSRLLKTYGYMNPNEAALLNDDEYTTVVDTDLPDEDSVTTMEHKPVTLAEGNKMLGYEDEEPLEVNFEDLPQHAIVIDESPMTLIETGEPMTLELACAMTNSKGVQYGTMPVAVLEKIISNLYKTLNTVGLADEDKAVAERKLKAAKIVYDSKKAQEIA